MARPLSSAPLRSPGTLSGHPLSLQECCISSPRRDMGADRAESDGRFLGKLWAPAPELPRGVTPTPSALQGIFPEGGFGGTKRGVWAASQPPSKLRLGPAQACPTRSPRRLLPERPASPLAQTRITCVSARSDSPAVAADKGSGGGGRRLGRERMGKAWRWRPEGEGRKRSWGRNRGTPAQAGRGRGTEAGRGRGRGRGLSRGRRGGRTASGGGVEERGWGG